MTRPFLTAVRPLGVLIAGVLILAAASAVTTDRADAVSPDATDVVFVAAGYDYPDALVGAVIAASHNAPILTVRGPDAGDRVPDATADELTRLEPEQVIILGGPAAVSERVETELGTYTDPEGNTDRLRGDDRFGTAAAISEALPDKVEDSDQLDGLDADAFSRDFHDHRVTLSRMLDSTGTLPELVDADNTDILTQGGVSLPDRCGTETATYNVRVDASGTIFDTDGADIVAMVGLDDPSDDTEGIVADTERRMQLHADQAYGNFSTQMLMALPEGDHEITLEGRLLLSPGEDADAQNASMMIEVLGYTCPILLPLPTDPLPTLPPVSP